jgi:hypothetical protein
MVTTVCKDCGSPFARKQNNVPAVGSALRYLIRRGIGIVITNWEIVAAHCQA